MTTSAAGAAATSAAGSGSVALGRDMRGDPLPPLAERLCPPLPPNRWLGWLGPLIVTLFAALLRFFDVATLFTQGPRAAFSLGRPDAFVFDETYYAKDAWSLLHFGVEQNYAENADKLILAGHYHVWAPGGSFVVHPPLGKWAIALGEWAFGMNPAGWRVAVAVMGVLMVLVFSRLVRRVTRSTLLGSLAGLLLAVDGLQLVESRTALLDLPMAFWVVCAVACLVADRDAARRRMLVAVDHAVDHAGGGRLPAGWWGPRLWWRPWRIGAGLCFGAGIATKWNAVFVLAAFGLLTWVWDVGARRAVGVVWAPAKSLVVDAIPAFLTTVGLSFVVYATSWAGWFASSDGYDRHWAASHPAGGLAAWLPDSVRSLWQYHREIWHFNTTLTASHPYASEAYTWLVMYRPVLFAFDDNIGPKNGCPTARCIRDVTALGTPVLWWGANVALVLCILYWARNRDWRFGMALVGVASTWLPWFAWLGRTTFSFYVVVTSPFLILAVVLCVGVLIGRPQASQTRRTWGVGVAGAFVVLAVLNFAYFYPLYVDALVPYRVWLQHMWLPSWI